MHRVNKTRKKLKGAMQRWLESAFTICIGKSLHCSQRQLVGLDFVDTPVDDSMVHLPSGISASGRNDYEPRASQQYNSREASGTGTRRSDAHRLRVQKMRRHNINADFG